MTYATTAFKYFDIIRVHGMNSFKELFVGDDI